jgi:hypothetical protein
VGLNAEGEKTIGDIVGGKSGSGEASLDCSAFVVTHQRRCLEGNFRSPEDCFVSMFHEDDTKNVGWKIFSRGALNL